MCFGGGGSSAPATTPLPKQAAANPGNGQEAITKAPTSMPAEDLPTTQQPNDGYKGVSSLSIKRKKGSGSAGNSSSSTGLNIPT